MITKAQIQLIRSLADKRERTATGLFVAEGHKLIEEIRLSHFTVRAVYALADSPEMAAEAEVVATKDMERMSQLKTPSDSIAVVELPQRDIAHASFKGLTLALDNLQNQGNLGTIIRLADWFGIENIVCSATSADCFNPKVVQATMGAILRVKVYYTDLAAFLRHERAAGRRIYGTFLEGSNIYSAALASDGIIVMGNEGNGISAECAAAISDKLFIPPFPPSRNGSESLNVAIATGIVCSEFRRR